VTLQCLFSMSSHTLAVSCVRWGGDGLLYSASKDTTINVWDSQVRRGCTAAEPSCAEAVDETYDCCVQQVNLQDSSCVMDSTDAVCPRSMQQGKLIRSLKGHGHWVNTLALSPEHALRTGAFDHTGSAPQDPNTARQVQSLCTSEAGKRCNGIPSHLWFRSSYHHIDQNKAVVDG
jgi:ribosome assembly protein 4